MTSIKFLRVSGVRTRKPAVLVVVDGYLVRWTPRKGWLCRCPDPDCRHADLIADLLDDRVIGGDDLADSPQTNPTQTPGDKP